MRQGGRVQPIFDNETIRVYQAYSDTIANTTLKADTFVAPPFKMNWMTSIKPSFLWMMCRAGREKTYFHRRSGLRGGQSTSAARPYRADRAQAGSTPESSLIQSQSIVGRLLQIVPRSEITLGGLGGDVPAGIESVRAPRRIRGIISRRSASNAACGIRGFVLTRSAGIGLSRPSLVGNPRALAPNPELLSARSHGVDVFDPRRCRLVFA